MLGDIMCVHPGGPRLHGTDEIRRSWAMIFADTTVRRQFKLRGRVIVGSADLRVHQLEENIQVVGTNFVAPPVLATNVYQRQRHGWSMILHHAAVAPTPLLAGTVPLPADTTPPRLH